MPLTCTIWNEATLTSTIQTFLSKTSVDRKNTNRPCISKGIDLTRQVTTQTRWWVVGTTLDLCLNVWRFLCFEFHSFKPSYLETFLLQNPYTVVTNIHHLDIQIRGLTVPWDVFECRSKNVLMSTLASTTKAQGGIL